MLRGEAIITYSEFERINETIGDADAKYKNPRNLCSGAVRQLNNEITAKRNVRFYAFAPVSYTHLDVYKRQSYTLSLGCADMGTGCDTILSQMAADCLETEFENIVAFGVDTDVSPYDSGSYASATTYATGNAVINACNELKKRIIRLGAEMLDVYKRQEEIRELFELIMEE